MLYMKPLLEYQAMLSSVDSVAECRIYPEPKESGILLESL